MSSSSYWWGAPQRQRPETCLALEPAADTWASGPSAWLLCLPGSAGSRASAAVGPVSRWSSAWPGRYQGGSVSPSGTTSHDSCARCRLVWGARGTSGACHADGSTTWRWRRQPVQSNDYYAVLKSSHNLFYPSHLPYHTLLDSRKAYLWIFHRAPIECQETHHGRHHCHSKTRNWRSAGPNVIVDESCATLIVISCLSRRCSGVPCSS